MRRWNCSRTMQESSSGSRDCDTKGTVLDMERMQLTLMALLISAVTVSAAAEDARLIDAAKRGDQPAGRALVADGVDVDARHPDGATALLWAAYR